MTTRRPAARVAVLLALVTGLAGLGGPAGVAGCARSAGHPAVAGLGTLVPASGTAKPPLTAAGPVTGPGLGQAGATPERPGSASARPGGPTNAGGVAPGGDGVPARGDGTFAVAPGGGARIGGGAALVTYRVEVERGIDWGDNEVWTPETFATAVDGILSDARGWTASARAPVTDANQGMVAASWSFQRVGARAAYRVRVLLATPDTTTRMCASAGMDTAGVYSCRYGAVEVINLRRWLRGAPGFPIDLGGYHAMVINHEMGHFLGFDHMGCPGAGRPAPVMQTQTMGLGGCRVNPYPFAADGSFIGGPWVAS